MREYAVTVTPKEKVYAGTWSNGEYTVNVWAASPAEATKKVRREYNDEEGRHGVRATFKARLAN